MGYDIRRHFEVFFPILRARDNAHVRVRPGTFKRIFDVAFTTYRLDLRPNSPHRNIPFLYLRHISQVRSCVVFFRK